MDSENKLRLLEEAKSLIARPTAKRLKQAADILIRIITEERKGVCQPAAFKVFRYEEDRPREEEQRVRLKKHICSICPFCGAHTFDLNTEIMQGQCLSCGQKSTNYKADMKERNKK